MAAIDSLPLKLAIRTVMEEIWYSNALPEWYTPERIDEAARIKRLSERASRYLEGATPLAALPLLLPKLTGGSRAWIVPAVNDQIIMQACVTNLAHAIVKGFDRNHVFSFVP